MTDKDKSAAMDLVVTGLGIAWAAAAPTIARAIAGGTPAEIVGAALSSAAHDISLRRIEHAHPGEHVSQIGIEALRLEDAADRLDAIAPITAAHLRIEVKELRRKAAAVAATPDTEPPPASGR